MFGEGSLGVGKRGGRGYRLRRVHTQIKSCRVAKTSDPPHRQTERRRERDCKTDSEDSEVNAERQRSWRSLCRRCRCRRRRRSRICLSWAFCAAAAVAAVALLFCFFIVVGLRLRNCVNIRGSDVDGAASVKKQSQRNAGIPSKQSFCCCCCFCFCFCTTPGSRDNARKLSRERRWQRQRWLRSSTDSASKT